MTILVGIGHCLQCKSYFVNIYQRETNEIDYLMCGICNCPIMRFDKNVGIQKETKNQ